MNKRQLIDAIADTTSVSKKDVTTVLDVALDLIQETVAAGERVAFTGFGSFDLSHRAARTAKNPSTGADVPVAESWKPRFKPGSGFVGLAALVQKGGDK